MLKSGSFAPALKRKRKRGGWSLKSGHYIEKGKRAA
jgi:hypothetical protein